jgi:hypothetical protein
MYQPKGKALKKIEIGLNSPSAAIKAAVFRFFVVPPPTVTDLVPSAPERLPIRLLSSQQ